MIVGPYGIGHQKSTSLGIEIHDSSPPITVPGNGELNQDIWILIVKCLNEDNDIFSFMGCCRLFYTIGTPELLRKIVTLRSTSQLESFHDFMMSDLHEFPHHFRHFHKLCLDFGLFLIDLSHAEMLADILTPATYLTMLEVHRLDYILNISTPVAAAMSNLSNLIILSVGGVDERGVEFLKGIKSPLRGLSVGYQEVHHPNQIAPLGACASTLSFLEVRPGTMSFQPTMMVFPLVETLRLPINGCVSSTSIFYSFPNLKRIDLIAMNDDLSYEDVREDHEVNMAKLDLYDGPIPNLEILAGDAYAIHQSALYCPVKKLLIEPLNEERADRAILPLVRRCRPSILRVHLDIYHNEASFEFLESFFAELVNATELKELWLVLAIECTFSRGSSVEYFINDLPRRMTPLPIQSISVSFCFPRCFEAYTDDYDQFVVNFDLRLWVLMAAKTIPSLRQVITFSMAHCTQTRYVITGVGNEERGMTTEPDYDGPWSFGSSYNVEEIPYDTTCMLRPSSSTSRATLRGIEPSIGIRDSFVYVREASESGTSHSGSSEEDYGSEDEGEGGEGEDTHKDE